MNTKIRSLGPREGILDTIFEEFGPYTKMSLPRSSIFVKFKNFIAKLHKNLE